MAGPKLAAAAAPDVPATPARHTFAIGSEDFLLDGQPLQIRCGEVHFARVPREYWRDRLQRVKAMGLNAVCAYLFWNYHEWEQGKFNWSGQADAAEFCRLAQEEGLWVVLRPGPYACAEWEMGGLPWWLLKQEDIALRTRDPRFLAASRAWLAEVGRVLGPQQVTRGGPILLVQVENEYGFFGNDLAYLQEMRRAVVDAGFDVPLFACNPTSKIGSPTPSELFKVVNFGRDPAAGFKALRAVQPTGPLMCGEFYPGWFDTWGAPHHLGNTPQYLADLAYMLEHRGSFSIYMAHGGTSFGLWSGADRPFKPDTSSYDYDAPIAENGALGEKFVATRALMAKHLLPGETLPPVPAPIPTMAVPAFPLDEIAPVFANLSAPQAEAQPRTFEAYDYARGAMVYRTTLPAGPAAVLEVGAAHDFGFVFVDGRRVGVLDRRARSYRLALPAREKPAQLDLLVYALGRVNFGVEVHDRKGLHGPVTLTAKASAPVTLAGWQVFAVPVEKGREALRWEKRGAGGAAATGPAFWRGDFEIGQPADTFLDLSHWGFGVVWVNGHCLGRFWNIGPTQTAYVPGPWLRAGRNEVVVLDLVGPEAPVLAGLARPILNALRPERDFSPVAAPGKLRLDGVKPVHSGTFAPGGDAQEVRFTAPVTGRQLCFEAVNAHDGKPVAAIAELELLGVDGQPLSHAAWTLAYVSSEEKAFEDGSAGNALDGQTANAWVTAWSSGAAAYPHRLVIDLGAPSKVSGLRYTPRSGADAAGRIKEYRVYVGDALVAR
ncbi:beta-galactosidase [Opitutus sp. ER46]|nr:beta-galactosidase [Opitutus sp. ER46]